VQLDVRAGIEEVLEHVPKGKADGVFGYAVLESECRQQCRLHGQEKLGVIHRWDGRSLVDSLGGFQELRAGRIKRGQGDAQMMRDKRKLDGKSGGTSGNQGSRSARRGVAQATQTYRIDLIANVHVVHTGVLTTRRDSSRPRCPADASDLQVSRMVSSERYARPCRD